MSARAMNLLAALCVALAAALMSLAAVAAIVWATIRGIDFLERL